MSSNRPPALGPAILVIFGITGDLAGRYLLPSLYHLVKNDLLHEQTRIVGLTRQDMTLDELLSKIELCVSEVDGICDPVAVKKLKSRLSLKKMDMTKASDYADLKSELDRIEDDCGVCMNRLYYLSIPPQVAGPIIRFLGEKGLNSSCQHGAASTRLLVEKPFGFDTASARELIDETAKQFGEEQIYRIDHYLAKETVQNILAFRFNNPVFEPLWNDEHIEYIEVLANEKIGIEGRANFYEPVGALRDLIQSHLLQVLALVMMENPHELDSEAIHENKAALMKQFSSVPPDMVSKEAVRGQYKSYRQEVGNSTSATETYAAVHIHVLSERWENIPVIVKTGKALEEKLSEVNVVFRPTDDSPHHNVLTFRISPTEGIDLSLRVKKPGFDDEVQPVEMDFDYKTTFKKDFTPTAYERVLIDAVRGDHTLFATAEEVLESWRVVQPVLDEWSKSDDGLVIYENGSAGPDISHLYPKK